MCVREVWVGVGEREREIEGVCVWKSEKWGSVLPWESERMKKWKGSGHRRRKKMREKKEIDRRKRERERERERERGRKKKEGQQ